MAGSQGSGSAAIIITMLTLLAVIRLAMAATYTVGDSAGWSANTDLKAWTAKKTFRVGDTLVFKYSSELHSVLQVSEADFKSCTLTPSIASYQTGLDSIVLSEATSYYFVCGTPGHCVEGMAMEISVSAGGSPSPSNSPAVSPAPQVSPALPPTPAPAPAPAPVPASSSPSPISPSPSPIIPSASPALPPIQAPAPANSKNSASTLHFASIILSSALLGALSLLF